MTHHEQQNTPSPVVLLDMLKGMWKSRAIQVAAQFRIADVLRDGPKSTAELAEATGTHAPSLYRLLRALASIGIFAEVQPDQFANTELSTFLRSDVPASMSNMAQMMGGEWEWRSWAALDYSIRTGQSAFPWVHGMDLWQYYRENPEAGKLFDQAMTSFSATVNQPIAKAYDFSSLSTLVDVGGGNGSLLTTLLLAYPALKGILFDRPSAIEGARERIAAAGLDGRCELVAGDFFEGVPRGADAYILKQVLHDWDDEGCIQILRNCRQAMQPNGRVLGAEQVLLPGKETSFGKFLDLQMLLEQQGRERTEEEFRRLYDTAGLEMKSVIPTASTHSILEGIAV